MLLISEILTRFEVEVLVLCRDKARILSGVEELMIAGVLAPCGVRVYGVEVLVIAGVLAICGVGLPVIT